MNPITAAMPWNLPSSVPADGVSPMGADAGIVGSWCLRRNCSITPRRLFQVYLGLCTVSLAIGAGFWALGATAVLAFAGLELLVVALALLVHALHVHDGEMVVLRPGFLEIEVRRGSQTRRARLALDWLRVELPRDERAAVEVHAVGQHLRLGRMVNYPRRLAFAQDLRRSVNEALRAPRAAV